MTPKPDRAATSASPAPMIPDPTIPTVWMSLMARQASYRWVTDAHRTPDGRPDGWAPAGGAPTPYARRMTSDHRGTVALFGGGPFVANDDVDRRLLTGAAADRVVVLPTADAFEEPAALVAAAMNWAERLGVQVEALMVLQRHDADDEGAAGVIDAVRAVYLVGDSAMHLRSVLKDTPVWRALEGVLARGGLVAGVGASAAALCDPMLDQRGGAFTLGLGLVSGVAIIPEADEWSEERLHRTRSLADRPLVELPTGSAAVRTADGWELVGDVVAHGELP